MKTGEQGLPDCSSNPEAAARRIRLSQRDVLPLPLLEMPLVASAASRGTSQRRSRTAAVVSDTNRCITALNQLYAEGSSPELFVESHGTTAAQARSQTLLRRACADAGRPPAILTPAEALRSLRLAGLYGGDAPVGPVPFDSAAVSLPPPGNVPVTLASWWGEGGDLFCERMISCSVAPLDLAQEQLLDAPAAAYSDPSFEQQAVWEDFVVRHARAGYCIARER